MQALKILVQGKSVPNREFRFVGGCSWLYLVQYSSLLGKTPAKASDDLNFPDVQLGIFDDGIVFDHTKDAHSYYYSSENRLAEVEKMIKQPSGSEALAYNQLKVNVTEKNFEEAVEKAKEYIVSGDIFQVVLSKRYEFRIKGDLISFYRSLRKINPSPYMYFFKAGDRQIVGSSPEMLVRVDNRDG
jgi:anthranilate synthase component I